LPHPSLISYFPQITDPAVSNNSEALTDYAYNSYFCYAVDPLLHPLHVHPYMQQHSARFVKDRCRVIEEGLGRRTFKAINHCQELAD